MIQMIVVDELKDFLQQQHMCFTDFLEALCRVASTLALPTHHNIVRAGVGSVREFMRSRARRQRLIAQRRASDVLGGGGEGGANDGAAGYYYYDAWCACSADGGEEGGSAGGRSGRGGDGAFSSPTLGRNSRNALTCFCLW